LQALLSAISKDRTNKKSRRGKALSLVPYHVGLLCDGHPCHGGRAIHLVVRRHVYANFDRYNVQMQVNRVELLINFLNNVSGAWTDTLARQSFIHSDQTDVSRVTVSDRIKSEIACLSDPSQKALR
jgi:hypothetical protein